MTLREAQSHFADLVQQLLAWLIQQGYQVTLDEAYRPPETAALYAQQGRGVAHSLHTQRLAIDLNLFDANGLLLTEYDQFVPVGQWWCALDPACAWGGNFASRDLRHFSLSWGGVQ